MITIAFVSCGMPKVGEFSMTSTGDSPLNTAKARREARLAEELRANLQKRKAQARSRRTGEADDRPDGLDAAVKKAAPESKS